MASDTPDIVARLTARRRAWAASPVRDCVVHMRFSDHLMCEAATEITRLRTDLAAAEAREAAKDEALRFYAEPYEYVQRNGLDEATPDFYDELDTGWRAREALTTDRAALSTLLAEERRKALEEIERLRPHYQSITAMDAGRRQMLNHFAAFFRDKQEKPDVEG